MKDESKTTRQYCPLCFSPMTQYEFDKSIWYCHNHSDEIVKINVKTEHE